MFKTDEKVYCQFEKDGRWFKRHYADFVSDEHLVWEDGCTSFTTNIADTAYSVITIKQYERMTNK